MGSLYQKYTHVRCECGGIIGFRSGRDFVCDKCDKEYWAHELDYDVIMSNDKTGWIFPMKVKEVESSED